MSRTTETAHVRGPQRAELIAAIVDHMATLGFVRVADAEREEALRAEPPPRRIALRTDGAWLSFADDEGFTNAGGDRLDRWGVHVSRALGCAVLTVWTWDGEEAVCAKRWEDGRAQHAEPLDGPDHGHLLDELP